LPRGTELELTKTSRITTLFTREFGKVRALAKGGRRLKSTFDVAFDLLTVCEVVFIRKASGLELLTEARMHEQFPALRKHLRRCTRVLRRRTAGRGLQDYDPHPALFDAAVGTLRALGGEPVPPSDPLASAVGPRCYPSFAACGFAGTARGGAREAASGGPVRGVGIRACLAPRAGL
jgi:DNA repair protein RecO (recombination protein O)